MSEPLQEPCFRVPNATTAIPDDLPPAARDFVALWVFAVQQAGRHWYGFVGERELVGRFVEDVRGLVAERMPAEPMAEKADGVVAEDKVAGEYEPGSGV